MQNEATVEPTAASLLERLQQADPAITDRESDVCRSCLVAVAVELHQQEDTALQRSLLQWWDWLDEEGYERDTFATILERLCTAEIDADGWTDLLAHCRSMASEPGGLPALMEHLQASHPELSLLLEELEAQAQQDEQQLMAVAGGRMSKAGIALTTVGSVVFVGAIATIGYCWWKSKKKAGNFEQNLHNNPQQVIHQDTTRLELAVGHQVRGQVAHAVQADNATVNQHLREAEHAREANPERVSPEKLLLQYTERDIQHAADKLALHYFRTEEGQALKATFGRLSPKTLDKIKTSYVNSGDFRSWYQDLHDTAQFERTEQAIANLRNWDRHPDFLRKIGLMEQRARQLQQLKIFKSISRGYVADLKSELDLAKARTEHLLNQAAKDEYMSLHLDEFPEYQRFKEIARAEERALVNEADDLVIVIEEAASGAFRNA